MTSTQVGSERLRAKLVLALFLLVPITAGAEDLERTLPATPGGELHVDLDGGRIEVESHDEPTVELDGYASGRYEFQVEQKGDRIIVRGKKRGLLPFFVGRVELHARVPAFFHLDLKTSGGRIEVQEIHGRVRAHTSGGNIELEEIEGDVEVSTSGGRIQAQEIGGELKARTSGGPIQVSEVLGDVDLETSGGTIRVSEAGGEVRARTSGGGIDVRFLGTPQGDLRTSGGSIKVEVGEDANFDLDAETSGGGVDVDEDLDFDGERRRGRLRGRLGSGGKRLDIRTSGGSIQIRER